MAKTKTYGLVLRVGRHQDLDRLFDDPPFVTVEPDNPKNLSGEVEQWFRVKSRLPLERGAPVFLALDQAVFARSLLYGWTSGPVTCDRTGETEKGVWIVWKQDDMCSMIDSPDRLIGRVSRRTGMAPVGTINEALDRNNSRVAVKRNSGRQPTE